MATNADSLPRLITIGVIAERVDAPVHRVTHILKTRPHIRPRALAGNLYLYDDLAVAMVRHELNAIDARRQGRAVAHA